MNDFTKDELLTLFKCVRLAEMDHGECHDLETVKNKIQSFINNYDLLNSAYFAKVSHPIDNE